MFQTSIQNIKDTQYRKNLEKFFLKYHEVLEEGVMDKYELENYYKMQLKGTTHSMSVLIEYHKQKLMLDQLILQNKNDPRFSQLIKNQGLPVDPEITKKNKRMRTVQYNNEFEQKILLKTHGNPQNNTNDKTNQANTDKKVKIL